MDRHFKKALFGIVLLPIVGCFTLTESPYPSTVMSRPPQTPLTVTVRGFEAKVLEYVTINGITTVYVDNWWGGYWYGPGYWETVPVSATMAQPRVTDLFRERARARFEEAGWAVMAQVPDYTVDVKFSGPTEESSAFAWRALRVVGTLFFSDRAIITYHAKLRIYDNRTGKLLFSRDYDETDEESMWSPVLVLGPLAYERTDSEHMRMRCLYALTDRATADASSYLSGGLR